MPQREILRVLNDEDGFNIKPRELMRVRSRNRWLLRMPPGDSARPLAPSSPVQESLDETLPNVDVDSALSLRGDKASLQHMSGDATTQHLDLEPRGDENLGTPIGKSGKKSRKRSRPPVNASGSPTRFPSEMTIDQARVILSIEFGVYREIRSAFRRICTEEDVSKKTLAGPGKWDAAKDRLVEECPQLQQALWASKEDDTEAKQHALDIICIDVTKRMRNMEARMSLADAKNVLGLNPAQSREIRLAFYAVLREAHLTCKSDTTPSEWEELKHKWIARVDPFKNLATSGTDFTSEENARAVEVLASDVMKRRRDDRSRRASRRKELPPPQLPQLPLRLQAEAQKQVQEQQQEQHQQQQKQQQPLSHPQPQSQLQQLQQQRDAHQSHHHQPHQQPFNDKSALGEVEDTQTSPSPSEPTFAIPTRRRSRSMEMENPTPTDEVDLGDGLGGGSFDAMAGVPQASRMPFAPTEASIAAHLPMSIQSQSSTLSDSPNDLPQPHRVLGSTMGTPVPLDAQMGPSMFLAADAQATFMNQQYVQSPFAATATPPSAVFHAVQPLPTAMAVFLRLHPSSTYVTSSSLWIGTMASQSLQELRHMAVEKIPGVMCASVEGIVKDGKGGELPLHIQDDEELGAYLAHLQGGTPTFAVQLVWKT